MLKASILVVALLLSASCSQSKQTRSTDADKSNSTTSKVDTVKLPVGHEEGYLAPEISLPDVNGKMVSLSSLRGKYVLIDFWASWCGPCRNEMPTVVKLYADYKDQNFEIFGVSLDTKKENWVKAIFDDHISWPQVSELKSWQSQAIKDYEVNAIPATFIIDPKGMIIAKDLRGEELKQFMKKLFNK